MIIFIEGIDKAGKSTLAKHLSNAFNLPIVHLSKPKTDDSYTEYLELIKEINGPIIFDRTFLGEYVYANLWRGGCKITFDQFRDLEDKLLKRCCSELALPTFFIYASAPAEIIKERCIIEKEDLLKQEQIDTCFKLYSEIMQDTSIEFIQYDSSLKKPMDIEEQINYILNMV